MIKLGVIMDPMGSINIKKDSTFAMLLAAQAKGWALHYMEVSDLYLRDGEARASWRTLTVQDDPQDWFGLQAPQDGALADLDIILMRKDPPFDSEYLHTTYLLSQAEAAGARVINPPQALREANEKLATVWFPQCAAPTLVTCCKDRLHGFLAEHGDIIVKPLDAMGGASIFRVRRDDPNANVIFETLTDNESRFTMAQRFIPEIAQGDKRILIIDGEPVPYALARIPAAGETRGNLAVGGRGVGVELTERDRWICQQVAPRMKEMGLMFVGIDVIGDYLTEVNITSPTCIRELDDLYGLDIAAQLMNAIEAKYCS
jgi:glutathione synthase